MSRSVLIGVNDVARRIRKLNIGDENGVARKIRAAWIGDANGLARLFYKSIINLFATAAFERGGDGATTGDVTAYKRGSGYAVFTFPAHEDFAGCESLILHFYIVSGHSDITVSLRNGTIANDEYERSESIATPIPEYRPGANGWHSIDVTAALDATNGGVTQADAAMNGIKVFMRSDYDSLIGGISGEYCPYLTLDSTGSSPVTPDVPDVPGGDVAFVANGDTVTITGATFTRLADSSVQLDNATFTAQGDGSVTIQ